MTSTQFTGSGTDDRLRAELEQLADSLAAKTSIAIAMPVREILAAIYRVLADVPRIPNYDDTLPWNEQPSWSNTITFSPRELPEAQQSVRAFFNDKTGKTCVMIEEADFCQEIELEPSVARGFFLAGLAAVAHAERQVITD